MMIVFVALAAFFFLETPTSEASTTQTPRASKTPFIIGGVIAEAGQFPYYVDMRYCGGALIAPDMVLTAAHCGNFTGMQVNIGALKPDSGDGGSQGRICSEWVGHPNYVNVTFDYDFALCKLDRPVVIDETKVKLVLNPQDSLIPSVGDELQVMGLGVTEWDATERGVELDYINVTAVSDDDCFWDLTDSMLCTGGKLDQNACSGDSGGALIKRAIREDGTEVHTHVGVVSYGYVGCTTKQNSAGYSKTSHVYKWIENTSCNDLNSIASFCPNPTPYQPGCDYGETEVIVFVTTDEFPTETTWSVHDIPNNGDEDDETRNTIYKQESDTLFVQYFKTQTNLCLNISSDCYRFDIKDSWGDGISSPSSGDVVAIDIGAETIYKSNDFTGATKTINFGTDCPAGEPMATQSPTVSPSPTATPTPLPTASPSYSPSEPPSRSPTSSPSSAPSVGPTKSPTATPTPLPTASPTATPTPLPTASPSYSPSEPPSRSPTSSPSSAPSVGPTKSPTAATLTPTKFVQNEEPEPVLQENTFPPEQQQQQQVEEFVQNEEPEPVLQQQQQQQQQQQVEEFVQNEEPEQCLGDVVMIMPTSGAIPNNIISIYDQSTTANVTVRINQVFSDSQIDHMYYQYSKNYFNSACYEVADMAFNTYEEITIQCTQKSEIALLELWIVSSGNADTKDTVPKCCHPTDERDNLTNKQFGTNYLISIKCKSACSQEVA